MTELSGIELREAVAAKVMGLARIERRWCYWDYEGSWCETPDPDMRPADGKGTSTERILPCYSADEGQHWNVVPFYESDIAAAWPVVEKMREMGYHPRTRDCGEKRQWAFYDHKLGHEREHRWAVCNADAEAICRAALAALEAK